MKTESAEKAAPSENPWVGIYRIVSVKTSLAQVFSNCRPCGGRHAFGTGIEQHYRSHKAHGTGHGESAKRVLTASPKVAANDELGVLAESFDQMIEGLRDRERIKETFGRFVTPEIAQAILEHQPVLGGENTEVSILFSDIRNTTTIREQLRPEAVVVLE